MVVSKIGSGLNENALKFLLPRWMNAFTGVLLRVGFPAIVFWIISIFTSHRTPPLSWRDRGKLLLLGGVCVFGYMTGLLQGLTYTTPVSSSLILCLEPVIVFVLCIFFFKARATWKKILGLTLGIAGALICILTQKTSDVATNPLLGNMMCLGGSVIYAIYLVLSKKLLQRIDMVTFNKWTFSGAAVVAACSLIFFPWSAPVLSQSLTSTPWLILGFVLIIPSTISYFLVDIGLKALSATVVALYGYLILIVAMVMSYILGQDHFEWIQMLSVALIVLSVYFVEIADNSAHKSQQGNN